MNSKNAGCWVFLSFMVISAMFALSGLSDIIAAATMLALGIIAVLLIVAPHVAVRWQALTSKSLWMQTLGRRLDEIPKKQREFIIRGTETPKELRFLIVVYRFMGVVILFVILAGGAILILRALAGSTGSR